MLSSNIPLRIVMLASACMVLSACKFTDSSDTADNSWSGTGANGSPPVIWGEPSTNALVNSAYEFTPEATDPDGDLIEFTIANKPAWAQFDTATGRLQGVPGSSYVGEAEGIVISVTDRRSVVSLPAFSIVVTQQPVQGGGGGPGGGGAGDGGGGGGNGGNGAGGGGSADRGDTSSPPSISGKPNKAAVIDAMYAFQPVASDPDGDSLSFSIVNKPLWARFDSTSGRLQGRPTMSDLGECAPIELTVTDGNSIVGLEPFTITVEAAGPSSYTLDWIPPTENVDDSPLTDLAGYKIYYGTSPGKYTESIRINSPGQTSYTIQNLTPGTYYLVMTSLSRRGLESGHSSQLEFHPQS
jgi:hypothetical protein